MGTDAALSWFDEMASAMKKRELALAGLSRWQAKVEAAEATIAELSATRERPERLPEASQLVAETNEIPPALRPVFGSVSNA